MTTYLSALVAGRCDEVAALTLTSTTPWCRSPKLLGYRLEGRPVAVSAGVKSHGGVCVPVVITISGGDISLPDGEHAWGYCLTTEGGTTADGKVHERGRWMVFDQGAG